MTCAIANHGLKIVIMSWDAHTIPGIVYFPKLVLVVTTQYHWVVSNRPVNISWRYLTLSWQRPLSYRNQSIDVQRKSVNWFLYDNGLRHERVKFQSVVLKKIAPPEHHKCQTRIWYPGKLLMVLLNNVLWYDKTVSLHFFLGRGKSVEISPESE